MSDDDFDFGDDLFGDEEGDERSLFSDEDAGGDDFDFADEGDFGDVGEGFDQFDLGGTEDVSFEDEEPAREGGGPSRAFIVIAAVMIIFFLGGLVLLFLLLSNRGPSPFEQTSTAIAQINATRAIEAEMTMQERERIAGLTQTATLASPTPTPTVPTDTPTPTETPTVEVEETAQIGPPLLTEPPEGTAEVTPQVIDRSAVELTATALAAVFQATLPPTPTQEEGFGVGGPASPTPFGALPDTGLFDDIAGGGGFGTILLAAFGLLGVIAGSRWLRNTYRSS